MAEHGEEDVDTPDANEEIGMARQEYQTDVQNYQFVKENSPYPKSIDSSVYMARQRMFSSAANLFAVKAHYTRLDGSDSLAVSPGSPSPSESEYYSAESGSNSLANLSSGEGPTADVFSLPATNLAPHRTSIALQPLIYQVAKLRLSITFHLSPLHRFRMSSPSLLANRGSLCIMTPWFRLHEPQKFSLLLLLGLLSCLL